MKKSELINKLACYVLGLKTDTEEDAKYVAELCIDLMIEKGALPPPIHNFYYKKGTEGANGLINEWEPEFAGEKDGK